MISYKRLENPQLLSGNGQVKIIFGLIKSNILTNVYQYILPLIGYGTNAFSNHLKHKIRVEIWWTVVEDEDYLNLKCLPTQTETVGHTR